MQRRTFLGGAAVAAVPAFAAAPLRVVASFSILADMAAQIGRGLVTVDTLVGPDQDVHVFEPRPRDLRQVMAAGVLLRNGLGLEGWMERLTTAAGFAGQVVIAAAQVTPRRMQEQGGAETIDPHAWQDPRNAVLYARAIADGLAAADPANAGHYAAGARQFIAAIEAADTWAAGLYAAIPPAARRIITTHDAFGYYGARYGIEFLAAEGISTDSEPSAKTIAALVAQIRRENIHALFLENMTNDRLATMLARETGAVIGGTVYADALSVPGGPAATYQAMLRHNGTLFAKAMLGNG
jgi:zinc/manganese transport system substrate-binding protein